MKPLVSVFWFIFTGLVLLPITNLRLPNHAKMALAVKQRKFMGFGVEKEMKNSP